MNKTKTNSFNGALLLNRDDLQDYCGCGRYTAEKIAEAAGARVSIGRRVLYNREKIRAYLDTLAE